MAPVYIVRTGRGLQYYLMVIHVLAGLAILLADLGLGWQAILVALLGGSLYLAWPAPRHWRLRLPDQGGMQLWHGDEWRPVELLADCSVQTWLTVLHWRWPDTGLVETLLILPGMLPVDDARQLRVRLRQALSAPEKPGNVMS